jgi:hypothetical protein
LFFVGARSKIGCFGIQMVEEKRDKSDTHTHKRNIGAKVINIVSDGVMCSSDMQKGAQNM